jgi:hypothetical protein
MDTGSLCRRAFAAAMLSSSITLLFCFPWNGITSNAKPPRKAPCNINPSRIWNGGDAFDPAFSSASADHPGQHELVLETQRKERTRRESHTPSTNTIVNAFPLNQSIAELESAAPVSSTDNSKATGSNVKAHIPMTANIANRAPVSFNLTRT